MSSYLQYMTELIGMSKSEQHIEHIYEFHAMVYQMIQELVPQIVRNELANIDKDLLVKIQTQINGKDVDFEDVRNYIREIIEDEIRKIVKEIRL